MQTVKQDVCMDAYATKLKCRPARISSECFPKLCAVADKPVRDYCVTRERISHKSCNHPNSLRSDIGVGRAADAPEGRPAGALPCLNTINCNEGGIERLHELSAGHRKTAFALKLNVLWMIERFGLERIGFLTLTFAQHVVSYKEAQKALHSLMTGVLKHRYPEYIVVMERMTSKRIHYHLLVVMAEDIRTGFDFVAVL